MYRSTLRSGVAAAFLFSLSILAGCGKEEAKKDDHHDDHKADAHAHAETGPHKGQLIEFGKEEYHGELVHDDAAHKVTIYLLDFAAVKSVAIADPELTVNLVVDGKPAQFKLPAVAQSDDPAGQSSRFELVNEAFCEALDDPKTTGRLNVTIAGKTYSGEVQHGDHGHAH